MSLDFSEIYLAVLVAIGAILVFDGLVFRPRRWARGGAVAARPWLVSQAWSLLPVILLVLVLRSFVFEPFRIPSASMMPGLVDGDFIVVDKYSYGLRLPVLNAKVLSIGKPRRGDVVVFRRPSDPSIHLIKRLVGLPGDHVIVHNNQVVINGKAASLKPAGIYEGGYGFTGAGLVTEQFGSGEHVVMFAPNRYATDYDAVVPAGHYFFMGDNRNDSEDSRFPDVGFVPEGNLVGPARRIWLNLKWPGWPIWQRIGTKIS
jgi:signal peptidase I